ncbi:MAG: Ig-like domain-containing protein, partial [Candidatus Neomarinimicrobiota bacterium]
MIHLNKDFLETIFITTLAVLLILAVGCGDSDDKDTVDPFIRFSFPEEFTVLSDIATIRLDAQDNTGIKQVTLTAEGDTLAKLTVEPYTFYWNTTTYPDCTDADSYTLLIAKAEDFAGNSRFTDRKFYLDNEGLPPIPVELFPPTNVTKHSAELSWEQSIDYDFSHYILRRDTIPEVTRDSDSLIRYDDPTSTHYVDLGAGISSFGLLEDTDYYYRVFVHDVFGRATGSDSVATVHTLLPQPVSLSATALITKYIAGLEWEPSTEDVAYYRLHRGPSPQPADLDSIAGFTEDTHSYIDSGLTASTTYYYYLYLIDEAGYTHRFRDQDVLALQTLALPPPVLRDPPTPITKYTATLAWETIEEQEDSSWIALYRGTGTTVDSTDVLVYTAPRNETFTHTDSPLKQDHTYRYRMRHWDSQNNIAWSNILTLTTQSLADIWSGGLGVIQQGKYELQLTWDRYSYSSADDFANYTLSRDGQVIFTSPNADDNQRTDKDLSKNTLYDYRLVVTDTSGASVAATLEASTRDIYPAEIVSLDATADWFYRVAWLPSQEPDGEFDRYELLRSADSTETFTDDDADNIADCLPGGDCVRVTTLTQRLPTAADTITYLDADTTLGDTAQAILPIYNYVVLTYDQAGRYVRSNVVGDTLYAPPSGVKLRGPNEHGSLSETSILLKWDRARWPSSGLEALLFSRCEVWRNKARGGAPP